MESSDQAYLSNQQYTQGKSISHKLKYRVDFTKDTLIENFEDRGWGRCGEHEEWNVYWAWPHSVKNLWNGHYRMGEQ